MVKKVGFLVGQVTMRLVVQAKCHGGGSVLPDAWRLGVRLDAAAATVSGAALAQQQRQPYR